MNGAGWTAHELAAIKDILMYEDAKRRRMCALHRRSHSAIAKKLTELRKGGAHEEIERMVKLSDQTKLLHILRLVFRELYEQIDELEQEINRLRLGDVGLDVEAPFDPWRFE